jgi:2,4-dienoyl-CoA reductase-like NADH-dependent reductase (Old Yellow Enzyme family)
MADAGGCPTPRLLDSIATLAKGEVGLIVPGAVYCSRHAQNLAGQSGLCTAEHSQCWRKTIDDVHARGSKLVFQVIHGGAETKPELTGGGAPMVPTVLAPGQREMTNTDIEEVIQQFIRAAVLAKAANADGIQLHAAHGYLLSAFLSPALNRRVDKWGGTTKKRLRIVSEMATEIRKVVTDCFSLSMKLNCADFVQGGLVPGQAAEHVWLLKKKFDFFEISGGTTLQYTIRTALNEKVLARAIEDTVERETVIRSARQAVKDVPFAEMYFRSGLQIIRTANPDANLVLVGGNRTFAQMEDVLRSEEADVISISRPFLCDPMLVKKFREGQLDKATCINCSSCVIYNGGGNFCRLRNPACV